MLELLTALQVGKETLGLVSALAELVKERKKEATLLELMARLQIDAVRLSRDLENQLRILSDHIQGYNLNPAMSLGQQFEGNARYDWITRYRLKTLREECCSMHRQMTSFLDDATAVLICSQRQDIAADALKANLAAKQDLDRLFLDQNTSLGMLVEGMLAVARKVTADLQAS